MRWLCLLALLLPLEQTPAAELLIAVATNFSAAAQQIREQFEAASGHRVKISTGSTGKLYSQLANGAPFEILLAADSAVPLKAIAAGLAVAGSQFSYAQGRLLLWSARALRFTDPQAYLERGRFDHLAIANPRSAPYGGAAQQVLQRLQLWDRLQPQLVFGDSITQTFQFIATGNATLGFIAQSQLQDWKGSPGSIWEIPASYYSPIDQHAVLLNRGQQNRAALEFLIFLKGAQARRIISRYGYTLPP